MTATNPFTHTGHQIADLQFRIQFLEADKRVQDLLIAKLQSALNFYDGIVLGDGEHDKVMLARDGDIFMRLMKMLGMDVSGSDVQEIVDRVEMQRSEIERLRELVELSVHEIKSQYCLRFPDADWGEAGEKNKVVLALRAALERQE